MSAIIENALIDLKGLLGQGQFLEAMDKYLADDVVLQEANGVPKIGKDVCIAAEKELLATVEEFIRYDINNVAISGNTSYYEAIMEFKTNDGQHHKFEQVNRTQWENGKIVNERYYHA
ncbi:nuclear transport factor 2 family protein [Flavivirga spongiicola]|uniref:Nuclear transport factor 2 family protein n=1 Tax=Flavivirga spongiicola TaxID=421621 RepID=A0ABU7XT06_9FLAO|nr:nuclear transport factor 2 family protein [Flavivirga sp. MEBiC05379]MDO5978706.1 nuclear transport factor 2 family protein [Flavivirga sp. MEBiC05379]